MESDGTWVAYHAACIIKQGPRRQSLAQVTPLAGWGRHRARLGRPSLADFVCGLWLRLTRSASCLSVVQHQLSLVLIGDNLSATKKLNPSFIIANRYHPHPLKGALNGPVT